MTSAPIDLRIGSLVLALCAATGCHRTRVDAPAPATVPPLAQQYCWWTSLRTSLPPDTVGARFARAFTTLGFSNVEQRANVDTVLVDDSNHVPEPVPKAFVIHAHSAELPLDSGVAQPTGRYEGLAVAWVRADTTRVRYYLARDPAMTGATHIGRCGALWRAAMQ
jgi:hypothetical protein